jgi:hypothetical protein
MFKFDGQNIVPLRNDVGCIAHKSIAYYDSFMVWLDAKGKIWLRNEESGSQDVISEAISETLARIPQSQLPEATAVCVDDSYKLYLGVVDGEPLRVVYNFRTNQWAIDSIRTKQLIQVEYVYSGNAHPHWFDDTGQMWVDEEGTDDNGEAIHMEAELGNDTFAVDESKRFIGVKIYSKAAIGTKLYAQVDGGEWKEVAQITRAVDSIPLQGLPIGSMVNFKLESSMTGDTPQIDKATVWYSREEDTFNASKR